MTNRLPLQAGPAKRVCVIGAGIAGLVSAKVLLGDGFDVTVFEKGPEPGGVWSPSRTYPGLHTNNPRDTYAFSDHPYSSTADDFPSAAQVREYLRSYAERFGVATRIRFNIEVKKLSQALAADGMECWEVEVEHQREPNRREVLRFEYVVVCNGVFSEPYIPPIEGIEHFEGQIVHSSQLTSGESISGQRVVVVGAGKSGHDCATWIAHEAKSCTLVFRRAHWMLPRYFFGLINCERMIYTRATEAGLPAYKRGVPTARINRVRRSITRLQWRLIARLLLRQFDIPADLMPETALPDGISLGGISTGGFYELVRAGSIRPKRGAIRRFGRGRTLELDSGESIEADTLVFATGWRQSVPFFDEALRSRIERDGRFHLYRMIVPVGVTNLGFIGYNSSTACQFTAEIAAHWLSQLFMETLRLPDAGEMEREVRALHQWLEGALPSRSQGFFVGPYIGHYADELLSDMGLRTRRTTNFVAENLLPLLPSRYAGLAEERRLAREIPSRDARGFYLSGAHTGIALLILLVWWVLSRFFVAPLLAG